MLRTQLARKKGSGARQIKAGIANSQRSSRLAAGGNPRQARRGSGRRGPRHSPAEEPACNRPARGVHRGASRHWRSAAGPGGGRGIAPRPPPPKATEPHLAGREGLLEWGGARAPRPRRRLISTCRAQAGAGTVQIKAAALCDPGPRTSALPGRPRSSAGGRGRKAARRQPSSQAGGPASVPGCGRAPRLPAFAAAEDGGQSRRPAPPPPGLLIAGRHLRRPEGVRGRASSRDRRPEAEA